VGLNGRRSAPSTATSAGSRGDGRALRVLVAGQRADDQVVDAERRELAFERVHQGGSDPLAAVRREHRQRLDLADARAGAPRVGDPRVLDGEDVRERVADRRVALVGEEQHGVGLAKTSSYSARRSAHVSASLT
jgi:hypothetical protein